MGFQSILLFIFSLTPLTWGLGVELNCPDIFSNGKNNITCKINKTAIENAGCDFKQNSVTFDLTVESIASTPCYVQYDSPEICTEDSHEKSCFCYKPVDDILEYGFHFTYNSSIHKHGSLECKLCVSPKTLNVTTTGSCKSFRDQADSTSRGHMISGIGLIVPGIPLLRQLLLMLLMAIGVDFYCLKSYVDGKKLFACKINRTAIQTANCLSFEKFVTFNLNFNSGLPSVTLCRIAYDSPGICSLKTGKDMCWCEVSGDIFTYKFLLPLMNLGSLNVNNNAQMDCKVCTLPKNMLNRTSSSGCTNVLKAEALSSGSWAPVAFAYGIIILLIAIVSYTILAK